MKKISRKKTILRIIDEKLNFKRLFYYEEGF
jgi:hypothetical protein